MILANATRVVYGDSNDAVGPVLTPALQTIGWARFSETRRQGLDAHQHAVYEICYIDDGMVSWWVEEEQFEVRRGDVFYTRPGEIHGGTDRMMHPCDLYWLHVPVTETTAELFATFAALGPRCFPASQVGPLFAQLHQEHCRPGPFAALSAQALLHQLLVMTLRARNASQQPNLSSTIQQAIEWMDHRLGETFVIQEAAAAVQMHPSRFYERFLAEVGQTPAEWRVRQRVARARSLLTDPEQSVTVIALSLGFATPQSFATAFKRYTGRTPTEYRSSEGVEKIKE